nr:hypothetical protein TetV2_00559 [Oceanusvirus sp.]
MGASCSLPSANEPVKRHRIEDHKEFYEFVLSDYVKNKYGDPVSVNGSDTDGPIPCSFSDDKVTVRFKEDKSITYDIVHGVLLSTSDTHDRQTRVKFNREMYAVDCQTADATHIGEGGFANVYLMRCGHNEYVAKVIHDNIISGKKLAQARQSLNQGNQIPEDVFNVLYELKMSDRAFNAFDRERKTDLISAIHPNIREVLSDQKVNDNFAIHSKYANGGEATVEHIRQHAEAFAGFLREIIDVMENQKIYYTDFKPENVLVHDGKFMLGDMGGFSDGDIKMHTKNYILPLKSTIGIEPKEIMSRSIVNTITKVYGAVPPVVMSDIVARLERNYRDNTRRNVYRSIGGGRRMNASTAAFLCGGAVCVASALLQ